MSIYEHERSFGEWADSQSAVPGYSEPPTQGDDQTQKTLSEALDEIESRANTATPGPWKVVSTLTQPSGLAIVTEGGPKSEDIAVLWRRPSGEIIPLRNCEANANLAAAARSDIPALVKALRRAVETLSDTAHEELAQLLREPAESASPSSAVADDKKVLEEKEAVSDSVKVVLQKALEPFARLADKFDIPPYAKDYPDSSLISGANPTVSYHCRITLGDCRNAKSALKLLSSPSVSSPVGGVSSVRPLESPEVYECPACSGALTHYERHHFRSCWRCEAIFPPAPSLSHVEQTQMEGDKGSAL